MKNSQPHRDGTIVAQYRADHPRCLLCGADAHHIHHIFGGTTCRIDTPANLAGLCVQCHAYCHTSPVEGKIDCLFAKLQAGEFSAVELDAMGGERIAGWLSRHEPSGGALMIAWLQLVQACEGKQ